MALGLLVAIAPGSARQANAIAQLPCPRPSKPRLPPPPNCQREPSVQASTFCMRLEAEPNATTAPGELVRYRLSLSTNGRQGGDRLIAALPYDPAAQELLNVRFSRPTAWVSSVTSGTIEMRLGSIDSGETLTATLDLRTRPEAPLGVALAGRANLDWAFRPDRAELRSNQVNLSTGATSTSRQSEQLAVGWEAEGSSVALATFGGFSGMESVSAWYQGPDGVDVALPPGRAEERGSISYLFDTAGLGPGTYQISLVGSCSHTMATGALVIPPP
jgi:hypothetical protein